jgi:flagellar motor switch protein FliM
MKEGDTLFFKKEKYARVIINEIPSFEAVVGSAGPNMAIQIQSVVEPAAQQ